VGSKPKESQEQAIEYCSVMPQSSASASPPVKRCWMLPIVKVQVLNGAERLGGHRSKSISGDRRCRPVGESQAQRCAWCAILSAKVPSEAAEMAEKRAGSAVREKQIA
jgi:hypothetical protein